jgi:hypothetical protein
MEQMVFRRLPACRKRLTVVEFDVKRPSIVGLHKPLAAERNDECAVARMGVRAGIGRQFVTRGILETPSRSKVVCLGTFSVSTRILEFPKVLIPLANCVNAKELIEDNANQQLRVFGQIQITNRNDSQV